MPPLWSYGLFILMAHVITINIARINPACECVVYQSVGGNTEGRFHTPNFPSYYSQGIECILFTFIGDLSEIVEIKFTEFDMMPNTSIGCRDYLRLFLHLDRPEVHEGSLHDQVLCGNMSNLPQKTFYSKSRSLIMEFHTTIPSRGFTGFRGLFKFLDEEQFQTDGTKQLGTMCSYDFSASRQSGNFFSPSYPQNYPPHSRCQYTFYGQSYDGTVKVQFQNIQIYYDGGSCQHSEDRIAIYDGLNSSAPLIKYLCGIKNHEEVISSTPYLYIEFHSDAFSQAQGFAANYTFQQKSHSLSTWHNPGSIYSTTTFNCNQDIFSNGKQINGTIHSQNYPSAYPSSTRCTYTFIGNSSHERIQIQFKRVDLFYDGGNAENPFDCDGQDSIRIFIKIDNDEKELANTCGKKIPKMYMSNIPWMKVVFDSGIRTHTNTGFEMEYRFLTNYGIPSGLQDDRKLCKFYYYSNIQSNGTIVSPNYPGFYPKNTECTYTFHGKSNERVRIQFLKFDVDGIKPRCEPKDKVDFVKFTNFDGGAEDMKMDKFCGRITDKIARPMESDLAFFKVTFKSNSMYDGNGFKAKYEFFKTESDDETKNEKQSGGTDSGTVLHPSYVVYFTVTLLTTKLTLML